MDKKEILDLIKTGEGLALEFKESINPTLGKEICAFANASGGKIILGVEDNGNVKGFNLTNFQNSQIQQIARNMDPSFEVSFESIDNLIVINVPEGKKKPYSAGGHFYLRVGANSQQLKRDELREFFKEEGLISFDEKLNKKFDLENDFNKESFKDFLKLAKITENQDKKIILKNLGLSESNYLFNAGVLLFCHKVSKFFLQGKVTCVLFEGISSNIIDKKEFDLDLISNYENAYNFILSKLNTKYIIERERTEKLELPKKAIREALMNAFIHRDYFLTGHIQVNIFIDRLEISNPGGLVKGLKKEDFGKISLPRNPLLFDLMSRTIYVEKAGTGIKRIKDAMEEYGLKVDFKSTGFFTVIFERENFGIASEKTSEKTSEKIIYLIKQNPEISAGKLGQKIGISSRAVEMQIAKLKDEGKIKRVGSAKGGRWEVLK